MATGMWRWKMLFITEMHSPSTEGSIDSHAGHFELATTWNLPTVHEPNVSIICLAAVLDVFARHYYHFTKEIQTCLTCSHHNIAPALIGITVNVKWASYSRRNELIGTCDTAWRIGARLSDNKSSKRLETSPKNTELKLICLGLSNVYRRFVSHLCKLRPHSMLCWKQKSLSSSAICWLWKQTA